MLKENEVVMLILGIGVLFLILMNIQQVKKIRFWILLSLSYFLLLMGWLFTVVEGFIFESLLNYLEHISYFASAVLMTIWCIKATARVKVEDQL